MKLKCIIIDDERSAIEILKGHITKMKHLHFSRSYKNPLTALEEISTKDKIDIIFIDINMPGISGLELAKNLRDKSRFLIFTTAHEQHTMAAFELRANQYMLKPISFEKFALEMDALIKTYDKNYGVGRPDSEEKTSIFYKGDRKTDFKALKISDIRYITSHGNYIQIYTKGKKNQITYGSLTEAENRLRGSNFIRISRFTIISGNAIAKVSGNCVQLDEGEEFKLTGPELKKAFFLFIKENAVTKVA